MAELTGIPTEGFFRSTASVHHFELSDLSRDEGALRDRLQASISGADRGTSRARKKLDKALHDLNTRGDRNPGRLKVAEQAVEQSQAALDQGELALAQLERDRDALAGARDRRADAETALAERRSLLEKARQAERIIAERDAASERYERYRQAVEVDIEIQRARQHPPVGRPRSPVLRDRRSSGCERSTGASASCGPRCRARSGSTSRSRRSRPGSRCRGCRSRSSSSGSLIVGGAGPAQVPRHRRPRASSSRLIGAVIAVVGLVLAAVALWLRRSYKLQAQMRDVEIDRRLRGRSEMEAELRDAEAKARAQLGALGLTDLAEAEDLLSREEAHVGQIDRLTAQLEGLVGKEPTETLPTLRDAAALEIAQKTSALEALGPIAKEPRARERLEVEVRDQEGALERARDDEANARARVEANTRRRRAGRRPGRAAGRLARAAGRARSAASASSPRRSRPSTGPSRRR